MSSSGRWAFLRQPRWVAGHVLVLAVSVAFLALGFWQLDRNDEKHARDDAAKAAYAAPATALPPAGREPEPGMRVEATGRYDGAVEVLLRNRVRDGEGGYDILTPLTLSDGTAVVVDRGWVPRNVIDNPRRDDQRRALQPPGGTVTVRGPIGASRPLGPDDTVDERGGRVSLPRVDLDRIGADAAVDVRAVYITAQYQDPGPVDGVPELPTPPPSSDVNHLQYAIQWFGLALIPIVGWPIVLWRVSLRRPAPARRAAHDQAQELPG